LAGVQRSPEFPAGGSFSRTPVAAAAEAEPGDGSGAGGWRSWRAAHDSAKKYEAELKEIMADASAMVRKLDDLFSKNISASASWYAPAPAPSAAGQTPENKTVAEEFGMGGLFTFAQPELAVPDVTKTPPMLAGEWATGKAIAGRFSSGLELPPRAYPAQFLVGTADDPEASDEENRLWKEAVGLVAESLDALYLEAEQSVAAVGAAEARAERRRGPVIKGFRKRVIQQMIYATDGVNSPDQLDEWLTTLQTDKRMVRYLALLERSALQAEELQALIRARQKEELEAPPGSQQRERISEAIRAAFGKTRGLDVRIRSCVVAAQDMPETLDAYEKLGKAWDDINPFKNFR